MTDLVDGAAGAVARARFNRRLRASIRTHIVFDVVDRSSTMCRLSTRPAIGLDLLPLHRLASGHGYELRVAVCWGDPAVIADWCGVRPLESVDLAAYDDALEGPITGDSPNGFLVEAPSLADPDPTIERIVDRVSGVVDAIGRGSLRSLEDLSMFCR